MPCWEPSVIGGRDGQGAVPYAAVPPSGPPVSCKLPGQIKERRGHRPLRSVLFFPPSAQAAAQLLGIVRAA